MKDERGTLVRVKSHRASAAIRRLLGDVQYHFVFMGHNDYCFVPDEHLEAALKIKSVGRARMPEQLSRCWAAD